MNATAGSSGTVPSSSLRQANGGDGEARTFGPLLAQTRAELLMTLRRGESVLLTMGIPLVLLAFFSKVDVLPTGTDKPVTFLAPGILALAVMSSAMVGLAIATGFERQYGVLKRIGTTPLGRGNLLVAKIAAIVVVEVIQVLLLTVVGLALGWRPPLGGWLLAIVAMLLGTAAFAGIGLTMAGRWKAEMVLAGANGLYILLLLASGMLIPLEKLPSAFRAIVRLLPSAALADTLRGLLTTGGSAPARAWAVLAVWAIIGPVLAARLFRWE